MGRRQFTPTKDGWECWPRKPSGSVVTLDHGFERQRLDAIRMPGAAEGFEAQLAEGTSRFLGRGEGLAGVEFAGIIGQRLAHRARHGQADVRIDVAAPAVSMQIKELELEVGLPLLRRWHVVNNSAKTLSPAAEAFRYFILERGEAFLTQHFARTGSS
jgi:hypothetical protein